MSHLFDDHIAIPPYVDSKNPICGLAKYVPYLHRGDRTCCQGIPSEWHTSQVAQHASPVSSLPAQTSQTTEWLYAVYLQQNATHREHPASYALPRRGLHPVEVIFPVEIRSDES